MKLLLALAVVLPFALAEPNSKPTTTVRCGNRALPPCPYGSTCVASPTAKCGPEVDCPGYCSKLPPPPPPKTTKTKTKTKKPKPTKTKKTTSKKPTATPKPAEPITCGGYVPDDQRVYCPAGQICQIQPSSICYSGQVTDCTGQCVGQPCGGLNPAAQACPRGQICVSRPPPDPPSFIDDSPGICVFDDTFCGGFTGQSNCPDQWKCVDNPNDSCAPPEGADCSGVCSFNKGISGNAGGDGPAASSS